MRVLRVGTAVGLGVAASLVCTLPAALRVSGSGLADVGPLRTWVALAAAALGPMIATVLILRAARDGLRAFGGEGAELRAFGAGLWLASLLVGFSLLGSVLRATTHHHALAGVTFAFGALVIALGAALVSARITGIMGRAPEGTRRVIGGCVSVVMAAAVAWVVMRFLRASQEPASAPAAATVIDALAFALASGFAARPSLASYRRLAILGPPIAAAVFGLGVATWRDSSLRGAIDERAPAYSPAVDIVGGP